MGKTWPLSRPVSSLQRIRPAPWAESQLEPGRRVGYILVVNGM